MPEPRGPEGAKCKCGHSMDQHTDSMAAAPCAFWGCRCDDFDQDPAPSPPRAGEPNVRPEDTTGRLGFDCFFPGLEGTCPQCGHEHVSLMRSPKHGWLCWPCAAAEQFALGVQDAEAPSPSPAGPGEAEVPEVPHATQVAGVTIPTEAMIREVLDRIVTDAKAGRETKLTVDALHLGMSYALRALLARLREAEENAASDRRVAFGLIREWKEEVARLSAELREAEEKSRRYQFAPMGDNHHNAALCPYCSPQSEVARLTAHLATARREEREAWWDLVDRAANALNDSICASGNRVSTNMHWVNKLRRDGEALRTREAAP